MNGYNTGWKFNGWWGVPSTANAGSPSSSFTRNGVTGWLPTYLSWMGNSSVEPIMAASICTHGYTAIRLRFAIYDSQATTPAITNPICWRVYLAESDNEEDQRDSMWMLTLHSTLLTAWPSITSVPTSSTATEHIFGGSATGLPFYGKTWACLANQIRTISNDSVLAGLVEVPSADSTTGAQWRKHAGPYLSRALGIDTFAVPSTFDTTNVPSFDVRSEAVHAPVYSPVFGTQQQGSAGEYYINNLAGAARIIVVPTYAYGYSPSTAQYSPPSVGSAGNATREVGFMYNLIQ